MVAKGESKSPEPIIREETLLDGPAAVGKVTGRRPHYSTFFRWTQRGVTAPNGCRVKLEFVKAAGKRMTSVEAVRRFFSATTNAAQSEVLPSRMPVHCASAISRAEQELNDLGVK